MNDTFILNSKETGFKPGQMILDAARNGGIEIPTLCDPTCEAHDVALVHGGAHGRTSIRCVVGSAVPLTAGSSAYGELVSAKMT